MKIQMLTSVAGEHNLEEGRDYDVPDHIGRLLCTEPADHPRALALDGKPVERAHRQISPRRARAETR